MKRLLLAITLLLGSQIIFYSGSFARTAWVDNKMLCEKTNGNWQFFNNNCGDICDSKFDALSCTSTSMFNCNCGEKRCWDGKKCVSDKIGKLAWEEKTSIVREQRLVELKAMEERRLEITQSIFTQTTNTIPNIQQPTSPTTTPATTTIPSIAPATPPAAPALTTNEIPAISTSTIAAVPPIDAKPTATPPIAAAPSAIIDPEVARKNAEQKAICETQKGQWKEFPNGCVGNCGSKIAKIAMCTMSITFGCECGGSKCWDGSKNICIELEEYKTLLSAAKPEQTLPKTDSKTPSTPATSSKPNSDQKPTLDPLPSFLTQ